MKFKFNATIILQVGGECELTADAQHVFTEDGITLIPTFMLDNATELKTLSEDERTHIMQVLTHNVLKRGVMQTHIKGVTEGVPVPLSAAPNDGTVN